MVGASVKSSVPNTLSKYSDPHLNLCLVWTCRSSALGERNIGPEFHVKLDLGCSGALGFQGPGCSTGFRPQGLQGVGLDGVGLGTCRTSYGAGLTFPGFGVCCIAQPTQP